MRGRMKDEDGEMDRPRRRRRLQRSREAKGREKLGRKQILMDTKVALKQVSALYFAAIRRLQVRSAAATRSALMWQLGGAATRERVTQEEEQWDSATDVTG
jgi:hypothetical protein